MRKAGSDIGQGREREGVVVSATGVRPATSSARVLTVSDVTALAEIASAAWQSARVRYVAPDGRVVEGTARCFTTPSGMFLSSSRSDIDVRDACLRVTTDMGFEMYPEVDYLMGLVHEGGFVIDRP